MRANKKSLRANEVSVAIQKPKEDWIASSQAPRNDGILYNKSLIRADFDKAAAHYDEYADLQKKVADKLFTIAENILLEKSNILDVGCGTGFLARQNKNWNMIQLDISYAMSAKAQQFSPVINADMESLPFQNNIFDGAISSLALQWANYPEIVFREVYKSLKPSATFVFSTLGEATLYEIKECFGAERVNEFESKESLIIALKNSGFKEISIKTSIKKFLYPDLFSLLKKVKGVGAGNKRDSRNSRLNREDLQQIEKNYFLQFAEDGKIPATWEIYYVTAKK